MTDANAKALVTSVRLEVTERAMRVIQELQATYGRLVLHESGIRGSQGSPVCYPDGEFDRGSSDILLGEVAGMPFFMSSTEMPSVIGSRLVLDVVPGQGNGLFLEDGCGMKFVTKLLPVVVRLS
jgi:uncharacterized protein